MKIVHIAAAAALLFGTATFASAQSDVPKSKTEPGAPTQGPTDATKSEPGVGSRPIGPPADATKPAPGNNPTGVTDEKRKSEQNDPQAGGKKQ